jgi:hypothetical protein
MRILVTIALVFMSLPLRTQIERGTVIVVYFSKDKIVVAGDSLNLAGEAGREKRVYGCKIAALSRNMLFAATGFTGYPKRPFDPLPGWMAIGEAKRIFSEHSTEPLNALSRYWTDALRDHFNAQLRLPAGRQVIGAAAVRQDGILTTGLFLYAPSQEDLQATVATITYLGFLAPVVAAEYQNVPPDTVTPIGPYFVLGHKKATDTVWEYVQLRSDRAKKEAEEWNQKQQSLNGDKEALRAKRLVELAIADDRTGYIGGEIDVAILPKDGTVTWAASPNCK